MELESGTDRNLLVAAYHENVMNAKAQMLSDFMKCSTIFCQFPIILNFDEGEVVLNPDALDLGARRGKA